ncbi:hypothetical protein CLV56_4006 [Mumia flava]|uniref:Phage gp6-like head-tail connector protein n=1 Tax=Mumia flava TaxID=1348852 RepID=A0A0B2BTG1_9ACTN|nr:hypothetical protein [Mumia flava]PJJ48301.1 hypothetical protein CLV56_4006 [Mumia flava]
MAAPVLGDVMAYLDDSSSWSDSVISSALASEKAAQAVRCRVPGDADDWPADLVEALCRRVAVNLANRALPLGVQASISEAAVAQTRVGGTDREVTRLEAPYRRVTLG